MVRVVSLSLPALIGAADDPALNNVVCGGDAHDKFMCADATAWTGTSGVEMAAADSCGDPCPPGMNYATSNDQVTCTAECLTCESTEFTSAASTYTMADPDNYKGCDDTSYTNEVSGTEMKNLFTGVSQTCSNAYGYIQKAHCVDGAVESIYCTYDCGTITDATDVDEATMSCVKCIVAGTGGGGSSGGSSNSNESNSAVRVGFGFV